MSCGVSWLAWRTCAAVESQSGRGVELLDEELGQGDAVVGAQRLVTALPVEHQVLVRVGVWREILR